MLSVRGSSWSGEQQLVNQTAAVLNVWSVLSRRACLRLATSLGLGLV